jgi:hypothetical protein
MASNEPQLGYALAAQHTIALVVMIGEKKNL